MPANEQVHWKWETKQLPRTERLQSSAPSGIENANAHFQRVSTTGVDVSIRLSSLVVVVVLGEVGLVEVDGKRVLTRRYGGVHVVVVVMNYKVESGARFRTTRDTRETHSVERGVIGLQRCLKDGYLRRKWKMNVERFPTAIELQMAALAPAAQTDFQSAEIVDMWLSTASVQRLLSFLPFIPLYVI
jgi:hypothetical protein